MRAASHLLPLASLFPGFLSPISQQALTSPSPLNSGLIALEHSFLIDFPPPVSFSKALLNLKGGGGGWGILRGADDLKPLQDAWTADTLTHPSSQQKASGEHSQAQKGQRKHSGMPPSHL